MAAIPQSSFWRRTPPAVFPPIMGLFGLGLAWRRAADVFPVSLAYGEVTLGATTVIFLFLFAAYMAKFFVRPATLIEDSRGLPGRTGLAAASLCVLLLAAAMMPYSTAFATFLLFGGLFWHLGLAAILVVVLLSLPRDQHKTTPAWHLSFVGFIVGPLAAAPLGFTSLAQVLLVGTIVSAAVIYAISAAQLIRQGPPPPQRPLLAIHLSPVSLFGSAAYLVGATGVAIGFAGLSTLLLTVLVARMRYIISAGFSPLWGAFTFPLAAYTGLMLALSGSGRVFAIVGALSLLAATISIPLIAARVLWLWARGSLAAGTGAAIA